MRSSERPGWVTGLDPFEDQEPVWNTALPHGVRKLGHFYTNAANAWLEGRSGVKSLAFLVCFISAKVALLARQSHQAKDCRCWQWEVQLVCPEAAGVLRWSLRKKEGRGPTKGRGDTPGAAVSAPRPEASL